MGQLTGPTVIPLAGSQRSAAVGLLAAVALRIQPEPSSRSVESMRKRSHLLASCGLVVVLGAPLLVHAEDRGDKYASLVVQNRKYSSNHEVSLFFGTLPLDAFIKGLTLSGSFMLPRATRTRWLSRSARRTQWQPQRLDRPAAQAGRGFACSPELS